MNNKKPIRVLHLLHTMAYGGIETVIINWFAKADAEKLDMHLVVFANPGQTELPFVKIANDKGIKVDLIPWGKRKPVIKAARQLMKLIKKYDCSIVHTHNTYAAIVGLIAGKILNRRLTNTYYVWDDSVVGLKRRLIQYIDIWVLKKYDQLTAQCEETIEDSGRMGFDRQQIRLLPSGFPSMPACLTNEHRQQLRSERGITPDNIVVCNIARFYPEKAQKLMLKCWTEVSKACPNARLWIYGVGPLEDELKSYSSALGLDDSVKFMGFAENLEIELELCDVQFHPSHKEGVPLAICSGMAAGLPILASRVGGLPEVIKHHDSGLLVEDGDKESFSRELINLIKDPALRSKLGNGARNFIREKYSIEYALDELRDSYKTMI